MIDSSLRDDRRPLAQNDRGCKIYSKLMNPIVALILANVIWGAAPPIFKLALGNIPPFTLAFLRFFLAALLFLPFIGKINWKILNRWDWLFLFLGSLFGITANITFFFLGLQKAPSINVSIIASAGPVFLYLLSVMFLKEQAKKRVLIGMLFGLLGVLVIILSPIFLDGQRLVAGEVTGNLLYVLSTIGSVLHPLFYKNILKKINFITATWISFVMVSITFLPLMLNELRVWSFRSLNYDGLSGIIFGVFFSSAAAYCLYNYGLSKIKAQETGLFTYIDPIITVLVAIPLLAEYPNIYFFIGSVLVFGGIFLAEGRIHWHPWHKITMHKAQSTKH